MPTTNLIGTIFSIDGSFPRHVQVSVKLTKNNQHCGPKCQITLRFVWALESLGAASWESTLLLLTEWSKSCGHLQLERERMLSLWSPHYTFPIKPLPPLTARGLTPVCSEYPQALRPALISLSHFLSPCLSSSPWSHSVPISYSSVL